MRRPLRLHPGQLTLRLTSAPEQPLVTMEEPTILQALADLLLEALGQGLPGPATAEVTTESADEPQDHA
jgi:hypothetical protein